MTPETTGVSSIADPEQIDGWGLRAWPALEEQQVGGWLLRFAGGHTKRSNAVYPLGRPARSIQWAVSNCELLYRLREIPATFRMTDTAQPPGLDAFLAVRGYDLIDRTWVLHCGIEDAPLGGPVPSRIRIRTVSCDVWLDAYEKLGLLDPPSMRLHREIVRRAQEEAFPLLAEQGGQILGLNLGVRTGAGIGLFGLYVVKSARRAGVGGALVRATLRAGTEAGATTAYLQVEASNAPARRLYDKHGFRPSHLYWYRMLR